jgi:hypothetical protein
MDTECRLPRAGSVMMVPEQLALNWNGWLLISPCIWSRADRAVTVGGNERRFMKDWESVNWFVKVSCSITALELPNKKGYEHRRSSRHG